MRFVKYRVTLNNAFFKKYIRWKKIILKNSYVVYTTYVYYYAEYPRVISYSQLNSRHEDIFIFDCSTYIF